MASDKANKAFIEEFFQAKFASDQELEANDKQVVLDSTGKMDLIEQFMKQYGRIYQNLNSRDQEIVMDSLTRDADIPLRGHAMAEEERIIADEFEEQFHERRGQEADGFVDRSPWEDVKQDVSLQALLEQDFHLWETDMAEKNPSKDGPSPLWGRGDAEIVNTQDSNLALDLSKESTDPTPSPTEAEKQADINDFGRFIDAHEHREVTWAQRVEERLEMSLFNGKGHADERLILSGGQTADSWATTVRPEKGLQDLAAAVKEMGIEPAVERQAAQDKSVEKGQERGGEGIEP